MATCPKCEHEIRYRQLMKHSWWTPIVCDECFEKLHFGKKGWFMACAPPCAVLISNAVIPLLDLSNVVKLVVLLVHLLLLIGAFGFFLLRLKHIELIPKRENEKTSNKNTPEPADVGHGKLRPDKMKKNKILLIVGCGVGLFLGISLVFTFWQAKQIHMKVAQLKIDNPQAVEFWGDSRIGIVEDQHIELENRYRNLRSLSDFGASDALGVLKAKYLNKLYLNLRGIPVRDISALRGIPLTSLSLYDTNVNDISALKGMPLEELFLSNSQVTSVNALKGMKLVTLFLNNTQVKEINALKGMPLISLFLDNTQVADISALKGMPLRTLDLSGTKVTDISVLKGMPLTALLIPQTAKDITVLRSLESLEEINYMPVSDFWKMHDANNKKAQ